MSYVQLPGTCTLRQRLYQLLTSQTKLTTPDIATRSLEEFAKLNPSVDLVQGAEMELTIRGDTLLYKNALGGMGRIQSAVFTKALCDVYYGNDAVSAPHRDAVLDGVSNL